MNRNSKRKAKELRKAFAAERRANRKVVSPPSRRRSRWKGALFNRRPQVAEPKIVEF